MPDNKPDEHRCIHGKVIHTFQAECKVGHGLAGWKSKGSPYICPYQWYHGDCSKYKPNPNYREV